jgi:hypothetical protein
VLCRAAPGRARAHPCSRDRAIGSRSCSVRRTPTSCAPCSRSTSGTPITARSAGDPLTGWWRSCARFARCAAR